MLEAFCVGAALILNSPPKSLDYLGDFKVTAYCSCSECCDDWADNRPDGKVIGAAGEELIPNYSVAVDSDVIPYGTEILIDGVSYIAHDTGSAIKGNRIEIYFENHDDALDFGVQKKKVFKEV